MSVETDVQQLQAEVAEIKKDLEISNHLNRKLNKYIEDFQASVSSRRGLPGARGESITGPAGAPGRDAVIKIVQANGKIQVVDMNGKVHAEVVAVKGDTGQKGDAGQSIVGPAGKDSTVPGPQGKSPSVDEVAAAVVKHINNRLA